jgi:hypothetical protein
MSRPKIIKKKRNLYIPFINQLSPFLSIEKLVNQKSQRVGFINRSATSQEVKIIKHWQLQTFNSMNLSQGATVSGGKVKW